MIKLDITMISLKEKTLGRTGLKVRTLGFGGIPVQRISEEEAIKVIIRSYELGINYFDTARGYTNSEERIGKAIKNILKDRTNLIITHRLHSIRTSDLILVMKNGEIVAQGEHDDLIVSSEDYRKVFGKQLEDGFIAQEVN